MISVLVFTCVFLRGREERGRVEWAHRPRHENHDELVLLAAATVITKPTIINMARRRSHRCGDPIICRVFTILVIAAGVVMR